MEMRSERKRRAERIGKRKKRLVSHNEKGTDNLGGGDINLRFKNRIHTRPNIPTSTTHKRSGT